MQDKSYLDGFRNARDFGVYEKALKTPKSSQLLYQKEIISFMRGLNE